MDRVTGGPPARRRSARLQFPVREHHEHARAQGPAARGSLQLRPGRHGALHPSRRSTARDRQRGGAELQAGCLQEAARVPRNGHAPGARRPGHRGPQDHRLPGDVDQLDGLRRGIAQPRDTGFRPGAHEGPHGPGSHRGGHHEGRAPADREVAGPRAIDHRLDGLLPPRIVETLRPHRRSPPGPRAGPGAGGPARRGAPGDAQGFPAGDSRQGRGIPSLRRRSSQRIGERTRRSGARRSWPASRQRMPSSRGRLPWRLPRSSPSSSRPRAR